MYTYIPEASGSRGSPRMTRIYPRAGSFARERSERARDEDRSAVSLQNAGIETLIYAHSTAYGGSPRICYTERRRDESSASTNGQLSSSSAELVRECAHGGTTFAETTTFLPNENPVLRLPGRAVVFATERAHMRDRQVSITYRCGGRNSPQQLRILPTISDTNHIPMRYREAGLHGRYRTQLQSAERRS